MTIGKIRGRGNVIANIFVSILPVSMFWYTRIGLRIHYPNHELRLEYTCTE